MRGAKPQAIRQLRESGYRVVSVRDEMRNNLIRKLRASETVFPGIIGYADSVVPQIENAILAGQDIIFLGERGQAKSRLARSLTNLLDEEVPIIAGCEINDNPFAPTCRACRDKVEEWGDDTEIAWIGREQRYSEKLATPDITVADLIGEVDPVRVAEGRYLSDELTIHYGLVPRTNRGIFCINELPDMAERIQVGLLNLMEERDIQIRGYKVLLPLDVYVVASANPEDYTNRGRIITPLKDRYGAQIRTHYPRSSEIELEIVDQERTPQPTGDYEVTVPQFMREIVAEITSLARRSSDVNQRSGVSVRVSIANYETMVANALKRAVRLGETRVVPRISDLPALIASTAGKIELESVDEGRDDQTIEKLLRGAVLNVFNRYFSAQDFAALLGRFEGGMTVEASDSIPSESYARWVRSAAGIREAASRLGVAEDAAGVASVAEFVLEGLHLSRRLNKDKVAGLIQYRSR